MLRKIIYLIIAVLVIIQFIHPNKNNSNDNSKDITTEYSVPDSVKTIWKKACNDCHSNYTEYPWYNNIQPIAWWLQNHVDEGKHHLNFSEFAAYTPKRKVHKLNDIAEVIEEGEMPLSSYTLIHKEAKLTKEENELLIKWARALSYQINPYQKEEPKEKH
jgi:hypothetical protein